MSEGMGYVKALEALTTALAQTGLPRGRALMLHVRLRGLRGATGLGYAECARLVLEAVDAFEPSAVLVPAFTYSFTKSGVFHRAHSRAETGRFSEEVRRNHARFRSPDPIFSVVDTTDWLAGQGGLACGSAFGPGCVFDLHERADGWIVNVDIAPNPMVATHVHYCEAAMGVPYRQDLVFSGVVCDEGGECRAVDYVYNARDLADERDLDWDKIEGYCQSAGILGNARACGVAVRGFSVRAFADMVRGGLAGDPLYLLSTKAEREARQ